MVCQGTQQGRAEPAHAKGKSIKQTGDHANLARQQFLCIHQYRGECGGEDHADENGEDTRPEKIYMGQEQREGSRAENGKPDHVFPSEPVAQWAAQDGAGRYGKQKNEEIDL